MTAINIKGIYEQLLEGARLEREGREMKDAAKRMLMKAIPENKSKAGITHKLVAKTSVSYAAAWADLNDKVLKASQLDDAAAVLAAHTKAGFWSDFVPSDEA